VFDGAPLRRDLGSQVIGAVSLLYPEPGGDADTVIRGLIDRAERASEWTVVTSDKPLYSYVRTRGAAVLRAHEWNALERGAAAVGRPVRGPRSAKGEKPEHEGDVAGWLRTFGSKTDDED
jgi:predicted RNA-binding protein with PIN domain